MIWKAPGGILNVLVGFLVRCVLRILSDERVVSLVCGLMFKGVTAQWGT